MDKHLDLLCPSDFPSIEHGGAHLQALARDFSDDRLREAVERCKADDDTGQLADVWMLSARRTSEDADGVTHAQRAAKLYADANAPASHVLMALGRALQRAPGDTALADALDEATRAHGDARREHLLLAWQLTTSRWDETEAVAQYERLGDLAMDALQSPDAAIDAWRRCLDLDPGRLDCVDRLASTYHAAGRLDEALQTLERGILVAGDEDPLRRASFHVRAARLLLGSGGDVAAAARHLQAAIKINPDDYEALRAFGILYQDSGRASGQGGDKAAAVFVKAGKTALKQGAVEASTRLLRRALGISASNAEGLRALEQVLVEREMWIELDEHYLAWLDVATQDQRPALLTRRAENLLTRLERREDARIAYEEVRGHQPPDGRAWSALRSIYEQMEDWTALTALLEAQHEALDDALDLDSLLTAARTYRDHLDNDERAAHFFYSILARDPFHAEAFEGYKEHWRRKHNWTYLRDVILYQIEKAEDEGDQGPLGDSSFAEEFVELADICERRIGDVEGALDAWRRLGSAFPDDPRPAKQVGRIEKRARMWDNMVKVQEAELERTSDPKNRIAILKRLVQIYRDRQVDPERAIELYLEILESAPNDLQSQRALTALYDRASRYEEVVAMLEAQYERSRSRTERCALLRRLSELWHHELKDPDRAVWACETILQEDPADTDAMHRLQLIYQERSQWQLLLKTMSAEVKVLESLEEKMALLRRMARIAGLELQREDLAFKIWKQLHALDSGNLEIIDTLAVYYATHGPDDALAALLKTSGELESTPRIRQLDYALRLGALAREQLGDADTAQEAFERALDLRPDHRGALQNLAEIYREQELHLQLCAVLQQLENMAESESEAWSIASERASYLADHLDQPEDAAAALIAASTELAYAGGDLNLRIRDCLESADDHEGATTHAELALLASDTTPEQSRGLFEQIVTARAALKDDLGALLTVERALTRFPTDATFRGLKLKYLERTFQYRSALALVDQTTDSSADGGVAALLRRADIEANRLLDLDAAARSLHSALAVDPDRPATRSAATDFAQRNDRWAWFVETMAAHVDEAPSLEICFERCGLVCEVLEQHVGDGERAYTWAERRFEIFDPHQDPAVAALEDLRRVAETFERWDAFRTTLVRASEVPALAQRRALAEHLILEASQIAREELDDPAGSAALLERVSTDAHLEEAESHLEKLIESHELHEAHARLLQRRIARSAPNDAVPLAIALADLQISALERVEEAFAGLRETSRELPLDDPNQETLRAAVERMAEDTESWSHLADHLGQLAQARMTAGAAKQGLADIHAAATTLAERSGDALAAARLLVAGLSAGPVARHLIEPADRMCEAVKTQEGIARGDEVAALTTLAVTQAELMWAETTPDRAIELYTRRAQCRASSLGDGTGACVELLRAQMLAPASPPRLEAVVQQALACEQPAQWLFAHALAMEHTAGIDDRDALRALVSEYYATQLKRPDLALRATLMTWEHDAPLPEDADALDPINARLWSLAADCKTFEPTPALEAPRCVAPEPEDLARWQALDLQPIKSSVLRLAPAVSNAPPPEEVEAIDSGVLESIDDDDLESMDAEEIEEIEDFEDFEELEELDSVEELEDVEDVEAIKNNRAPPSRSGPPRRTSPPARKSTPADSLAPSLPIPVLTAALVAQHGDAPDAWTRIDQAYVAATNDAPLLDLRSVTARALMWEFGAGEGQKARALLEQGLVATDLAPDLLERYEAAVERAPGDGVLASAYERMLDELTSPSATLTLRRRLTRQYEQAGELDRARTHYEAICDLDPSDDESLEALVTLLGKTDDVVAELRWQGTLLARQKPALDDAEYVRRALALAARHARDLEDPSECITRITKIIREFPENTEAPLELAEFRFAREEWPKGVDVLKTALENLSDSEDFQRRAHERMAEIYETQLDLPARAITSWEVVRALSPGARHFIEPLKRLYLAAGRSEEALALVDEELANSGDGSRLELLRTKASALVGMEARRDEWKAALLEICELAPEDETPVLQLADAHSADNDFGAAEAVVRARFDTMESTAPGRKGLGLKLAGLIARGRRDRSAAYGVLDALASDFEDDPEIHASRASVARDFDDVEVLARVLTASTRASSWLESGLLYLRRLEDFEAGRAQIERVIEHEISQKTDGPGRLLEAAEAVVLYFERTDQVDQTVPYLERLLEREGLPTAVAARILSLIAAHEFASTGDLARAQGRFQHALDANPDEVPALIGLARLLASAGKHEDAEPLVERALTQLQIEDDPDLRVDALTLFSEILETSGRHGEAYRKLTSALRDRTDDLRLRLAIARNRNDAAKYKDVVVAAEQLRQWINDRDVDAFGAEDRGRAARILALGARAERELGRDEPAFTLLSEALRFDPAATPALEMKLELATAKDRFHEVFAAADALRLQSEDLEEREALVLQLLSAGPLAVAAGEAPDDTLQRISQRTLHLFGELLTAFDEGRVQTSPQTRLIKVLEAATSFALQADDLDTSLRSFARLIELTEDGTRTYELHLSAADAAREAAPEQSLAHAHQALLLIPNAPAATFLQLQALHALDRMDEFTEVAQGAVPSDPSALTEEARGETARVMTLWANHAADDASFIAALEQALRLDDTEVTLGQRLRLAAAHARAGVDSEESSANHRAILRHQPTNRDSLLALARRAVQNHELLQAHAIHEVLVSLADPPEESQRFLASHQVTLEGTTAPETDALDTVIPAPSDPGICAALETLWPHLAPVLAEHLPTREMADEAKISAMDDSPIARAWSSALKRAGPSKAALALAEASDNDDGPLCAVRCQTPPLIEVQSRAATLPRALLTVALLRGLATARVPDVLLTGLSPEDRTRVLYAILRVVHPRYSRRRSGGMEEPRELVQALTRKIPAKLARTISAQFADEGETPFDTCLWERYAHTRANCFALGRTPSLLPSLELSGVNLPLPASTDAEDVAIESGVRDMLAYHLSEACARVRAEVGFRCAADGSDASSTDSPST